MGLSGSKAAMKIREDAKDSFFFNIYEIETNIEQKVFNFFLRELSVLFLLLVL